MEAGEEKKPPQKNHTIHYLKILKYDENKEKWRKA